MAWTITYRLVRDTPLTEADREALVRHVVRHNRQRWNDGSFPLYLALAPREDGQVAWGQTTWQSEDDLDLPRFLTAVTELREVVPSCTAVLTDSAGRVGWRGGKRMRYMMGEKPQSTDLVDPSDISSGWVSAYHVAIPGDLEISAPVRAAMASEVARMSPPRMGMSSPHVLREVLDALEKVGPRGGMPVTVLCAVLASLGTDEVVPAGRARGDRLPSEARAVLDALA